MIVTDKVSPLHPKHGVEKPTDEPYAQIGISEFQDPKSDTLIICTSQQHIVAVQAAFNIKACYALFWDNMMSIRKRKKIIIFQPLGDQPRDMELNQVQVWRQHKATDGRIFYL
jgi:hypothetical protein